MACDRQHPTLPPGLSHNCFGHWCQRVHFATRDGDVGACPDKLHGDCATDPSARACYQNSAPFKRGAIHRLTPSEYVRLRRTASNSTNANTMGTATRRILLAVGLAS